MKNRLINKPKNKNDILAGLNDDDPNDIKEHAINKEIKELQELLEAKKR
jgi:hypothetical protein